MKLGCESKHEYLIHIILFLVIITNITVPFFDRILLNKIPIGRQNGLEIEIKLQYELPKIKDPTVTIQIIKKARVEKVKNAKISIPHSTVRRTKRRRNKRNAESILVIPVVVLALLILVQMKRPMIMINQEVFVQRCEIK